MKILRPWRWTPKAVVFVAVLFSSFQAATAATLTAHWVGAANGSWNTANNWDLGQVPNNSGSDVFDVIWDAHPVTVSVDQPIEIHSLTWAAGGTIQLQAGLMVDGDFSCATGTLLGGGMLSVGGKTTHSSGQRIDLSVQAVFTQGFFQTDGKLRIEGAMILEPSVLHVDGGELSGYGTVFSAQVNSLLTPSPRELSFGSLLLGPNAQTIFDIAGKNAGVDFDRITVSKELTLGGLLQIAFGNGFQTAIQPTDSIEIIAVKSNAQFVQGHFVNVSFGQRLNTSDGFGSFLVEQPLPNARSVILSGFMGSSPSDFEFATTVPYPFPPASCVLDPLATVTSPVGQDWSGGRLSVKFVAGFDAAQDHLDLQSAGNGAGQISVDGSGPSRSIRFEGTEFANLTTALGAGQLDCAFGAGATAKAVQALLRSLVMSSSSFGPDAFTTVQTRFPARSLELTLTDPAGHQTMRTEAVEFPFLTGLHCQPAAAFLDANESTEIDLIGDFSNGAAVAVPRLQFQVESDGDSRALNLQQIPSTAAVKVTGGMLPDQTRHVTLRSEPLQAQATVFVNEPSVIEFLYVISVTDPGSGTVVPMSRFKTASSEPSRVISLPSFVALQTLMLQTAEGKRLADVYWQHSREAISIMRTNLPLAQAAVQTILNFQDAVEALLAGNGKGVQITQAMVDQLNSVWERLSASASDPLKTALETERGRFSGFQMFVGKNFLDWSTLLQIPAPTQPWIYLSDPILFGGRFRAEANAVAGLALSLWRSMDLKQWQPLSNSLSVLPSSAVIFNDSNAVPAQLFYQLRGSPPP